MKSLVLLLSLLLVVHASGAEMEVIGKHFSDTGCRNYSTTSGVFNVTYKERLQWGTRVFIKFAYKNDYNGIDWYGEQLIEMHASEPYTWSAQIRDLLAVQSAFLKSELNFIFMIITESGQITIDNGSGSTYGHYNVEIPPMECTENSPPNRLTITAIEK